MRLRKLLALAILMAVAVPALPAAASCACPVKKTERRGCCAPPPGETVPTTRGGCCEMGADPAPIHHAEEVPRPSDTNRSEFAGPAHEGDTASAAVRVGSPLSRDAAEASLKAPPESWLRNCALLI